MTQFPPVQKTISEFRLGEKKFPKGRHRPDIAPLERWIHPAVTGDLSLPREHGVPFQNREAWIEQKLHNLSLIVIMHGKELAFTNAEL